MEERGAFAQASGGVAPGKDLQALAADTLGVTEIELSWTGVTAGTITIPFVRPRATRREPIAQVLDAAVRHLAVRGPDGAPDWAVRLQVTYPLRHGGTIDLAVGERHEGPILRRRDNQRLDRRTAHRWVRAIGKRAGLGSVHPHMLRAAFIMAALDAGVPLRDVQIAARHADPRTTTIYDRRRQNFDRHAAYVVVAFVAGG